MKCPICDSKVDDISMGEGNAYRCSRLLCRFHSNNLDYPITENNDLIKQAAENISTMSVCLKNDNTKEIERVIGLYFENLLNERNEMILDKHNNWEPPKDW